MNNGKFNLITALSEFETIKSIEKTIISIDLILKAYLEIIEEIYSSKPQIKNGEVFIETLSMKIILATRSVLEISKGFCFNTTSKLTTLKLVDFSSVNILTRSIIEAFLTLEYLYYNKLDEDERQFRYNIWKISGYKSRQNFFDINDKLNDNHKSKLDFEKDEIESLLTELKSNKYYNILDKQNLWKLDMYGLPRLNSWSSLLKESILNHNNFSIPYKLYSNYAHSEFISLIQMNGEDVLCKGSENSDLALKNALQVVKMINCVSITCLFNEFDCLLKAFDKLDIELKNTISFNCCLATEEMINP